MKYYHIIYFLFFPLFVLPTSAQHFNETNYKQIKSMENGEWNFGSEWYYYFLHKDYSGAKSRWRWSGFKSGWVCEFDEGRSNVKRVFATREEALATHMLKEKEVEGYHDRMKAVHNEEVKRSIERNIDLAYSTYEKDFLRLNDQINEGFAYILMESSSKLRPNIIELSKELSLINERIAYFRKTGIGYELENIKREKGYISAKEDLQKLLSKTKRLALRAKLLY